MKQLDPKNPDRLIFEGRTGKPFRHTKLWEKTVALVGLEGRTFHWLRYSCGTALAANGLNQASIMAVMNHSTLTASARYMHANIDDTKRVIAGVFG